MDCLGSKGVVTSCNEGDIDCCKKMLAGCDLGKDLRFVKRAR